ncbi:MAG: PAS domain-containing protein [Alphaproteobacteria bacterium]|nr:PAS domain-containing protein [Alphaproteobacteria bacterium]
MNVVRSGGAAPAPRQLDGTGGSLPVEHLSWKLARLYRYWESKHGADGAMPRRRDIDPVEIARAIPELLPHVWLVEVLRDPFRFRYRLVGEAIVEAGSPYRTGDVMGPPAPGEQSRSLYENLLQVCQGRTWSYRCGAPTLPHSRHVQVVERLSLPLQGEAGEVGMILSASLYSWQEGWGVDSRSG